MKEWKDRVKGIAAKESTLKIEGDFREFTHLMQKVVGRRLPEKKEKQPTPASAYPGPAVS